MSVEARRTFIDPPEVPWGVRKLFFTSWPIRMSRACRRKAIEARDVIV